MASFHRWRKEWKLGCECHHRPGSLGCSLSDHARNFIALNLEFWAFQSAVLPLDSKSFETRSLIRICDLLCELEVSCACYCLIYRKCSHDFHALLDIKNNQDYPLEKFTLALSCLPPYDFLTNFGFQHRSSEVNQDYRDVPPYWPGSS